MKYLLALCATLSLQTAACAGAPVRETASYVANTGNAYIDAFVTAVQKRDTSDVESRISKFETISGLYPQFKTAREYLSWVEGCKISRVAQHGFDVSGDPVAIDRNLKTGPRAARAGYVYWISWDCPKGKFRQALNGDFKAPKVLVSELLPPAREIPLMRPPA